MIIRNQQTVRWTKKLQKSSVTMYAAGFLLIVSFLVVSYKNSGNSDTSDVASAKSSTQSSVINQSDQQVSTAKISVDQLTAASAVTNLAEATDLPVAGDLREATTTLYIKKQLSQTDAEVISKPQIVQPATSSDRGLTTYTTQEGDDITKIAEKFGVSAQTVRWANNTTSDAVQPGQTLTVPLVDGVLYTSKEGDTLDIIADRYKVDAERIMLYNDLDADQPLPSNIRIVLPNADLPETERPGYVAPQPAISSYYGSSATTSTSYGYVRASVGNRYASGNCTWYAYERRAALGRPIGSFWGNAYSWASSANAAGFFVDKNPQPGDVFQTSSGGGGYGHVGIVERVDDQNIYVSDMNYAGYNVISNRTIPRSALGAYNFIH